MNNTSNDSLNEQLSDSQLATIVGFQPDNVEENIDTDAETVEDQQAADTQLRQADPRNYFTNSPFWSNPFIKLLAVMAGTSVFAFTGYQLLNSLMKPLPSRQSTLQQFPLPDEKSQEQKQAIEGEVALGDQIRDFEKFSEEPKPITNKPKQPKPTEQQIKPPQQVPLQNSTARPRPYYIPPQTIRRQVPPVSVSLRRPLPSPAPTPPPVKQQLPTPALTSVDPQEQWIKLAKIGSYGTSSIAPVQEPAIADTPNNQRNQQAVQEVSSKALQPQLSMQSDQGQLSSGADTELAPILQGQTPVQQLIQGGTYAKAVLVTPLAWDKVSTSDDNYTIVLSEPLLAADRSVVLPAQTQLVTKVRSLSETGIIRLFAVKVFVEQGGQFMEMQLPENVLQIRGAKGKPLIAKNFNQDGSRNDNVKRFALGTLRDAADGLDGSLQGVIQQGAETLLDDLKTRNSTQFSSGNQNIFYLPAGTRVEVFVDQPTNLNVSVTDSQT